MNFSSRGSRTQYDRFYTAKKRRQRDRQFDRADAPDAVCMCGWVTAFDVCPNCGLTKVSNDNDDPTTETPQET